MKILIQLTRILLVLYTVVLVSCSDPAPRKVIILETTDVHGFILPYDFVEKSELKASLAGVSGYIKKTGIERGELVLLDNGDNLQGQPEEYYYNFIDTISPHFNSLVMNYMGYDAGTVGNHDIEAGHSVYDRVRKEYRFPMLAANAVDIKTGEPYFEPYTIIIKNKLKIAVFGLVTPSIPDWLPPELYSGMEFRDMVETAKKWMPEILKNKPDVVVGLFHSGWDKEYRNEKGTGQMNENGSAAVAYKVPGFNVIFNGHDHAIANEKIVNSAGDTVLILDGGSRAEKIASAAIVVSGKRINGVRNVRAEGSIIDVKDFAPDKEFLDMFADNNKVIRTYVDKVIGESVTSVSSRESFFGSSAFTDMIHSFQLEVSKADISFSAPLSFDVEIKKGPVTVGDLFKLYRFENMLYTMKLSGSEILKYLEFSYSLWFNTMKGKNDHLMNFRTGHDGKPVITNGRARLRNQSYNFDSAVGIDYTVDVSKPAGNRITIKGFSDGRPFEMDKIYLVAVNSYRGSGGGDHFYEGVGLTPEKLRSRLVSSTQKDLRYYILKSVEKKKSLDPLPVNNWKVIPEDWVKAAKQKDYILLFGNNGGK
jgi:2',3'-cyclic-nucleotide 2'-phosphodiesterase/3'-nucleotidase